MESILFALGREVLAAVFKKMPWQVVGERLATRILVRQLRKLTKMDTNDIDEVREQEILDELYSKRLKAAKGKEGLHDTDVHLQ